MRSFASLIALSLLTPSLMLGCSDAEPYVSHSSSQEEKAAASDSDGNDALDKLIPDADSVNNSDENNAADFVGEDAFDANPLTASESEAFAHQSESGEDALELTSSNLGTVKSMPNPNPNHAKGTAIRNSIQKLPFHHQSNYARTGYYFIPKNTPSKGMPILVLFHGYKDNGLNLVRMLQPFAKAYHVALIAPDSAGDQWKVPPKNYYSSDSVHVRDAIYWMKKAVGGDKKVDWKHFGALGHSFGARMASAHGTNFSSFTAIMVSHGRYLDASMGNNKVSFWMSGSPRDNQFNFSVMRQQQKAFNKSHPNWPNGGAKLHTYDCAECFHPPRGAELNDVVRWFSGIK